MKRLRDQKPSLLKSRAKRLLGIVVIAALLINISVIAWAGQDVAPVVLPDSIINEEPEPIAQHPDVDESDEGVSPTTENPDVVEGPEGQEGQLDELQEAPPVADNSPGENIVIADDVIVPDDSPASAASTTDEPIVDPNAVSSVALEPLNVSARRGGTVQFYATVSVTEGSTRAVTWSISGAKDSKTGISSDGLLSIGAGEDADKITVVAQSKADTTKTASTTVTVQKVTGITVTPSSIDLKRGEDTKFTADVAVANGADQTVTWSVSGANSFTYIDENGNLEIAPDETATSLTVTATSNADPTRSSTSAVKVQWIEKMTIDPPSAVALQGETKTFTVDVTEQGGLAKTVTWSLVPAGGYKSGTKITPKTDTTAELEIAADEDKPSITIMATSTADPSESVVAEVMLGATGDIKLFALQDSVVKGQTLYIGMKNDTAKTVNWSIDSTKSTLSSKSDTGALLQVAADESATAIKVTAEAADNSTKAEFIVNIETVTSVEVTPKTAMVERGDMQAFAAAVKPDGIDNAVKWTISSTPTDSKTRITPSGVLMIGADETAQTIQVTATSVHDSSKSASATVTVQGIANIGITPSTAIVVVGKTAKFTANVTVLQGDEAKTVNWSVSGNSDKDTKIAADGTLSVSANEKASKLTVTATSTVDSRKTATATVQVSKVSGITLTPLTATVAKGGQVQFTATLTTNGVDDDGGIEWIYSGHTSSSTTLVNGLLKVGADEKSSTIIITARSLFSPSDIKKSAVVKVQDGITGVSITPASAAVLKGGTQQFTAVVTAPDTANKSVTWTLSGESDSVIDNNGLLMVGDNESAKELTITATSVADTTKLATAKVAIQEVTSVTITPQSARVLVGHKKQFEAAVVATDGTDKSVTWSVEGGDDTDISDDGVLNVGADETELFVLVTATSTMDPSKNDTINVEIQAVDKIKIVSDTTTVYRGESQKFGYDIDMRNADDNEDPDIAWSLAGASNSSIDSDGVLSVGKDETADKLTIKLTSEVDSTKYDTLEVTVSDRDSTSSPSPSPSPTATGTGSGSGSGSGSGGSAPQTSDESPLAAWILIMIAAAFAIASVVLYRKNGQKSR